MGSFSLRRIAEKGPTGPLGRGGDWEDSPPLSDDVVHHLAMDVRQPEIATRVLVGKAGMIEPQQVENGRVQIV